MVAAVLLAALGAAVVKLVETARVDVVVEVTVAVSKEVADSRVAAETQLLVEKAEAIAEHEPRHVVWGLQVGRPAKVEY